jgi:hypothetical protein
MTDGGSEESRPERDDSDDGLLASLGAAARALDPVPAGVAQAAKAAFTWRTIDAELAALVYDSAEQGLVGVRGAPARRSLSFEYADVVVDMELDEGERTLTGQVAPRAVDWIELHQAGSGIPVRVDADELGRFRMTGVRPGPFRLLCRFAASTPFPMLLTDWVGA